MDSLGTQITFSDRVNITFEQTTNAPIFNFHIDPTNVLQIPETVNPTCESAVVYSLEYRDFAYEDTVITDFATTNQKKSVAPFSYQQNVYPQDIRVSRALVVGDLSDYEKCGIFPIPEEYFGSQNHLISFVLNTGTGDIALLQNEASQKRTTHDGSLFHRKIDTQYPVEVNVDSHSFVIMSEEFHPTQGTVVMEIFLEPEDFERLNRMVSDTDADYGFSIERRFNKKNGVTYVTHELVTSYWNKSQPEPAVKVPKFVSIPIKNITFESVPTEKYIKPTS